LGVGATETGKYRCRHDNRACDFHVTAAHLQSFDAEPMEIQVFKPCKLGKVQADREKGLTSALNRSRRARYKPSSPTMRPFIPYHACHITE
jgi:hypothetical protein